ncbi:MAG: hypothetical protein OXE76_11220 [Alphaproteobacteria bacterium]|nr:hypothetical protein [Alphaproteobacteria bacterium]
MNTTSETPLDEQGKWLVILGSQGEDYAKFIAGLQRLRATPITGNAWLIHQDEYSTAEDLIADIGRKSGSTPDKMIATWYFTHAPDYGQIVGFSEEFKNPPEIRSVSLRGRGVSRSGA